MRPCEVDQLALKPFAPDNRVMVVGEDRISRPVTFGGAGRFEETPALTLFLPEDASYPIGSTLTVNMLTTARPTRGDIHLEDSEGIRAPRVADSRLSFECVVQATGLLAGENAPSAIVVVRVLAAHQRWPRGCAAA